MAKGSRGLGRGTATGSRGPDVGEGRPPTRSSASLESITLVEHETLESLPLSLPRVRALRRFAPKLEVRPSLTGGFDLIATSWIGNLRVDGLSVTVRPKLPMPRVLFLVSYALDPDAWRETEFDYAEEERLLEAMAPGFVALCRRTLARGLRRGYRRREAALHTVRGRLRFDEQLRRRFGRFPPAEVAYDEFTADIAENRVLLAAIERLGRLRPRSPVMRRNLRRLRARFQGVTLVDYATRPLPEIPFNRLNRHYQPAVRMARLVLRDSSVSQRAGAVRSSALLVDMNRVFEDFVVVALREALGLTGTSFPQGARGRRLWLDRRHRVRLEPDLSWWRTGKPVFVGDVKYKDLDRGGVRNEDLYQVLAYLDATGLRRGMLLYASRASSRETVVASDSGREVIVRGLDVTVDPEGLLAQVDDVAAEIRSWAGGGEDEGERVVRGEPGTAVPA